MSLTLFAKIISRAFDLYTWSLLLNTLFLFRSRLTTSQITLLLPLLFLFEVFLPLALFSFLLKKRVITDIDISRRRERPFYFSALFVLVAFGVISSFLFGNRFYFSLQLTALLALGLMVVISLFWKISGHLLVNSAGFFFINFFFGGSFGWLYWLLPVVGWSRWYLKKHDFWQLLAGAILGSLVPYLVLGFSRGASL